MNPNNKKRSIDQVKESCSSNPLQSHSKKAKHETEEIFRVRLFIHGKLFKYSKNDKNFHLLEERLVDFLKSQSTIFKIPISHDDKIALYYLDFNRNWNRLSIEQNSNQTIKDLCKYGRKHEQSIVLEICFEVVLNYKGNKQFAPSAMRLVDFLGKDKFQNFAYIVNNDTLNVKSLKGCEEKLAILYCDPSIQFVKLSKLKQPVVLIYPITRYHNVEVRIAFQEMPNKKDIMKFYNRLITKEHKQLIIEAYHDDPDRDMNDAIKDIISGKIAKPKYKDLMSSLQFYEGLTKSKNAENEYYVNLGS